MKHKNTIKVVSKWIAGEAHGYVAITALVIIFGMICMTVITTFHTP